MKKQSLFFAIAGCALATSLSSPAQEQGIWHPTNSTAISITGDVTITDLRLSLDYKSFPIAKIRALKPEELSAAFDAELNAGVGNLYRLSVPSAQKFMRKNSLCGSEDTQWMATYLAGRNLQLAFFSGQKMPVFTVDAISNTTDLCGVFAYTR
jgi:hypothetical protein